MDENNPRAGSLKTFTSLFLIIFLTISLIISGTLYYIYRFQLQSRVEHLKTMGRNSLAGHTAMMAHIFEGLISDLVFLSEHRDLQSYLDQGGETALDGVEESFQSFSKARGIYDQIRFLDQRGQEVVRINLKQGNCSIVDRKKLQDKSQRYYFKDNFHDETVRLFVSPMDLNVEQGQVEYPFKPMIRLGMIVFDRQGRRRGMVILNYLARNLLDLLRQTGRGRNGQTLLANRNGYWLLGPRPGDNWGFMLPERKDRNIYTSFPLSAPQITREKKGQLFNQEGLFTYVEAHPLAPDQYTGSDRELLWNLITSQSYHQEYHCQLISHISPADLRWYHTGLLRNLLLFGIGLMLLTALGAWLVARSVVRQKAHKDQLIRLAHYDILTGLPNRSLFFDRLERALESAKRYDRIFALLYLDLDGFKEVNDTLGHTAGDELLIQVAHRLLETVRKSDTVGRLGGDEFMLILNELTNSEDAQKVAANILEVMAREFQVEGRTVTIGASIGISMYPLDAEKSDRLVELADKAMYSCKERGKNCYLSFHDL